MTIRSSSETSSQQQQPNPDHSVPIFLSEYLKNTSLYIFVSSFPSSCLIKNQNIKELFMHIVSDLGNMTLYYKQKLSEIDCAVLVHYFFLGYLSSKISNILTSDIQPRSSTSDESIIQAYVRSASGKKSYMDFHTIIYWSKTSWGFLIFPSFSK